MPSAITPLPKEGNLPVQNSLIPITIRQIANLPELSLEVRTQLPASKLRTGHYNAVASSFEGKGPLKMALRLLNEMKVAETISNTVTYSFAIDACRTSGEGVKAVTLGTDMQAAEIKTDVVIYNSALFACTKGDRETAHTHAQTVPRRHLPGIQSTPTITHTHSPRHTDTPALKLSHRHLHTLNPQIPSPDSYNHNNATNIYAVYLSSRKDYSSNTRSNHKQIKPLDRNDRNLVQFGFFVNSKAPGDSPCSQLQSGAIKYKKGAVLTKLFTIPSNTHPGLIFAMGHALVSIRAIVLLLTITASWHIAASILQGVLRAVCLATCITLTPMALTVRSLRWGYTNLFNNTLRNVTILCMGHLLNRWLYLPSTCITPPHLIFAFYVSIIYLGYSLATACYTVGRTLVGAAANYILRAMRKKRHRTAVILVTSLACLAVCSHPDRIGLETLTPRVRILPLYYTSHTITHQ